MISKCSADTLTKPTTTASTNTNDVSIFIDVPLYFLHVRCWYLATKYAGSALNLLPSKGWRAGYMALVKKRGSFCNCVTTDELQSNLFYWLHICWWHLLLATLLCVFLEPTDVSSILWPNFQSNNHFGYYTVTTYIVRLHQSYRRRVLLIIIQLWLYQNNLYK